MTQSFITSSVKLTARDHARTITYTCVSIGMSMTVSDNENPYSTFKGKSASFHPMENMAAL